MRIPLVEDGTVLADSIADILRKNGYDVDIAKDGEEGLYFALNGRFDTIVLDIMLPCVDGLSVLRRLREEKQYVPVLLLTARSSAVDIVRGLDAGADDYLTKPFVAEELLTRIRALGRRNHECFLMDELSMGDLQFHRGTKILSCQGRQVRLSNKEYALMEALLSEPGKIISKDTLYLKVWGLSADTEYNSVEVYLSFLRKKLAGLKSHIEIRMARGQGYFLEESHG